MGCDVIKQRPCINLEPSRSLLEKISVLSYCVCERFFSSLDLHQVRLSPHDGTHSYCAFNYWGILYSPKSERQLALLPLFNP